VDRRQKGLLLLLVLLIGLAGYRALHRGPRVPELPIQGDCVAIDLGRGPLRVVCARAGDRDALERQISRTVRRAGIRGARAPHPRLAVPGQIEVDRRTGAFRAEPMRPGIEFAIGRRLDVCRAGADELELLPGIGPARARAIVEHRRQSGGLSSVDDLVSVPGIGPRTVARLRPVATCGTARARGPD
jgi:competence ComEA-like helix-hairpin-helix protein